MPFTCFVTHQKCTCVMNDVFTLQSMYVCELMLSKWTSSALMIYCLFYETHKKNYKNWATLLLIFNYMLRLRTRPSYIVFAFTVE